MNEDERVLKDLSVARQDKPRRWRRSAGAPDESYAAALRAELVLLREENAQLRGQLSEPNFVNDVAEELLALSGQQPADEIKDVAVQARMMRATLADVCNELAHTSVTLQTRLLGLQANLPARFPADPGPADG
ncbi:MAG: hypothetical protein H0V22_10480 [Solirubrobacterales bacterium]|nr:hypothetical protein [Solirubrobacterales bacterium]